MSRLLLRVGELQFYRCVQHSHNSREMAKRSPASGMASTLQLLQRGRCAVHLVVSFSGAGIRSRISSTWTCKAIDVSADQIAGMGLGVANNDR